jgi:hypothetical protein
MLRMIDSIDVGRFARALSAAALLLLSACSSTSTAPSVSSQAPCVPGAIAGSWKDFRMAQLGPSWLTLNLKCDCSYDSTTQLLWMRVNEHGRYDVSGDEIVFQRASGEVTRWRFRIEDNALILTEAPGDERSYRRSQRADCD